MNYYEAITIARKALYDTGLIELASDGNEEKMVGRPETEHDQTQETADETARAYNKLSRMHNLLNDGFIGIIDRIY